MTAEDLLKAVKELEDIYNKKIFSEWCVLINPITYYENEEVFKEIKDSIKFVKNPLCPEDRVYVVAKDVLERMCGEGGDKGC